MTRTRKSHWRSLLKAAFAIAILSAVAWFVSWRDRLVCSTGGQELVVAGDIVGNWRADQVDFRVAQDAEFTPGWPAEVVAAAARGEPLHVVRKEVPSGSEPRFDWRPGMLRIFRELEPSGLALALGMLIFGALVGVTRWWRLLGVAGCAATWMTTMRLTFLGYFFNLVMPGLTGGDFVKAVLVVREHPERRADAFMSVWVDRGLGLLVLVGIAATVTLFLPAQFGSLRLPVVGCFLCALAGLCLALHPAPRRWFRIEALIARLPMRERLTKLDRALRVYNEHPLELGLAVVFSIVNHLSLGLGIWALGRAFGDTLGYLTYLGVAAIANTVSSIPIAPPNGWGVREAAWGYLFNLFGSPASLGVAVSITYGLLTMALGLAGGLFLLLPSGRSVRAEIQAGQAVD